MKLFKIEHKAISEVRQWCLDHLGAENIRWWTSPIGGTWNGVTARFDQDMHLFIDVTEEEENNLTYFILRYGQ